MSGLQVEKPGLLSKPLYIYKRNNLHLEVSQNEVLDC